MSMHAILGCKALMVEPLKNLDNNFKLYPNPSNGKVFIDYSIDFTDKATIVLNNAMGQQIYVADLLGINHQKELNLFNLKTGIYTYQILQNGRVVKTGKLTLIN